MDMLSRLGITFLRDLMSDVLHYIQKYLFCKRDWIGKKKLLRILFLKSFQYCLRLSSNCFLAF